jgi:hypothetical protein
LNITNPFVALPGSDFANVADLVVAHREIALPFRITGIGCGEALGNREPDLIGF